MYVCRSKSAKTVDRVGRSANADGSKTEDAVTAEKQDQEVSAEQFVLAGSALHGAEAPGRVLVVPWGRVESSNGTFVVDVEAGQRVMEAFAKQGTDLPVDYEHQSLGGTYASPNGQAPAAGWIRSLELVPSDEGEAGLFAHVDWTDAAKAKLKAREYRYLSPVVLVRKRDRRVVALHSVALTNKPAIVGMKPIVNRQRDGDAIAGEARDGDSVRVDEAVEVLRLRLGLEADSDAHAVLVAAEEQLRELTESVAERSAGDRVAAAMCEGKLTPAQREWAFRLALRDSAGFDEWMATAPRVVSLGRTEAPVDAGGERERSRATVIASARRAFQSEPELALLTTESAWIRQALREARLPENAADAGVSRHEHR